MKKINVVIHGALGRVGLVLTPAIARETDMRLVGAIDLRAGEIELPLPPGHGRVPFSANLSEVLDQTKPDVMVDFSLAAAVLPAARMALERGVRVVIGTTGMSEDNVAQIEQLAEAHRTGAVIASNFALGAVLMMYFARIAGRYLDHAEIIELHHNLKADAPSGTALTTARDMAAARGKPFTPSGAPAESRGMAVDGINIHSIRLPGLNAHQEILFGAQGQTLSIRHDAMSREAYIPGVLLAVREVMNRHGLTRGLDPLLNL